MSLTTLEEQRLLLLETKVEELQVLVKNAASKDMLNALLTLSNKNIRKVQEDLDTANTDLTTLIELARSLQ
jgi:hypothetical protein